MKSLSKMLLALVFLCTGLQAESRLQEFPGCTLVGSTWEDGDSFPVKLPDGREITLRLYGADCIEWHVNTETDARRLRAQRRYFGIGGGDSAASIATARAHGKRASIRMRELLAQPFSVHTAFTGTRGSEKFGRVYAFVTTSDRIDLSAQLVGEGLARAYGITRPAPDGSSGTEYRDSLRDLELAAAGSRTGIWADTDWQRLAADRAEERRETAELQEILRPSVPPEGLDPNTATAEELASLPGIGSTRAKRIVEARKTAFFRSPQDLQQVKGISPRLIESIAPQLKMGSQ
jgi:endonuclease YncB( thermonuclease family)